MRPPPMLLLGDCTALLPTLEAEAFHSCVTDPPYHLTSIVKRLSKAGATDVAKNFSKIIDGQSTNPFASVAKGFMGKQWDGGDIAFRPETWAEVYRVLKPGAFLAAFASTRGYHRMTCAIEDAGFVIHPMVGWVFGTGFPKATRFQNEGMDGWRYGLQALKPALEPICLAQKPLEGTGTENWLTHGCGGLNIDGCRVEGKFESGWSKSGSKASENLAMSGANYAREPKPDNENGRWPANLVHDGSDEVLEAFPRAPGQQGFVGAVHGARDSVNVYGDYGTRPDAAPRGDSGSAARFFYAAKASAADRAGSKHPTVKPQSLMRWLTRLITPPGGRILDPFAGSGSTGQAALAEGFFPTLIEQDPVYVADIMHRMGSL